uniref:G-protein coupled receptors family 1 profile domain-containing protein n=1 Tax=Erpetoichthys calabaricus TaxID=27687 RepID=A0A8C4XBV6_ERPCA
WLSLSPLHHLIYDLKDMQMNGSKMVTEFELVGFPGLLDYNLVLFVGFLLLLLITLTANLLILFLVSLDHRLHTPMYFFLCNLSLLDLLVATSILPKLLAVLSGYAKTISFAGCFAQMYSLNFILAAMAYDRYIAVVKPLHYNIIINGKKCFLIMAVTWILGFLYPVANTILASSLPYCSSNKIMHCYCDYPAVLSLACAEVTSQADGAFGLAIVGNYVPLIYVTWTYVKIMLSVLRLNTRESRTKAISMCSSHVALVVMYYVFGSIVYAELKMEGFSYERRILVGSLSFLVIPVVNPLIYSLRNEKIKEAAKKYLKLYAIWKM